ncbi:MAG: hypothetical protein WAX06_10695 [Lactococcus lactis]
MWVLNTRKEQAKHKILSDINSNISNLTHYSNQINQQISRTMSLSGGSRVNKDKEISNDQKKATQNITEGLTSLHIALSHAKELDIYDWVDDYD